MIEQATRRLYEPHLKAHRLVPARVARIPSAQEVALLAQARAMLKEALPLLDRLPLMLEAQEAPQAAHQALELLTSIVTALPADLASGLEGALAQVDWAFLRVLNQPGHPGLIAQVLEALGATGEGELPALVPEPCQEEIDALRRLHRALVSLQLEWDALVDATLPPAPEPPLCADQGRDAHVQRAAVLPGGIVLKKRAAPQVGRRPTSARPARPQAGPLPGSNGLHRARSQRLRVLLLLALVFLAASGAGALLLKNLHPQTFDPGAAAVAVQQPGLAQAVPLNTPTPAATQQSDPLPGPAASSPHLRPPSMPQISRASALLAHPRLPPAN